MKTLVLSILLFVSTGVCLPAAAQTAGKIAVVRLFEDAGARRLFISYGGGKTEQQELAGVVGKKDQKANTEQLQQLIARLYAEGYSLIHSFGGGTAEAPVSTLVFRQE